MAISLTDCRCRPRQDLPRLARPGPGPAAGRAQDRLLGLRLRRELRRRPAKPDDVVFEDQGVKVFVDPDSLPLINGTTVDFVKQGLNEAFRFRNPNIKGECGCGESFNV